MISIAPRCYPSLQPVVLLQGLVLVPHSSSELTARPGFAVALPILAKEQKEHAAVALKESSAEVAADIDV
jgi:hypothetical protein